MEKQIDIFGQEAKRDWEKEWEGMPEFKQENKDAKRRLLILFKNEKDVEEFGKLVNQKIGNQRSIWFPAENREAPKNFLYSYIEEDDEK